MPCVSSRSRGRLVGLLLGAALWLLPAPLPAHPHAWIDVRSSFVLDDGGRLLTLAQEWTLDPVYSLLLAQEVLDAKPPRQQAFLDELAMVIGERIAGFGYLVDLRRDGRRLEAHLSRPLTIERDGVRLRIRFTLGFPERPRVTGDRLRLAVFDPTYYIAMAHPEPAAVTVRGAGSGCEVQLRAPDPDPEIAALAGALDRGAAPDPELGRHFAQQAEVRCAP